MGFEKKSFIALSINYFFFTLPGDLPDSPSGPSGKLPGLGVFEKITEYTKFHQWVSPRFTSAFVDSVRSCPPKVEKTSSKIGGFIGKSRRHSATVCEGICPYPKWIHSKHTNTFRVTFRIHLPGLPGPFRDSVFWTMANTAGMHSGRMIKFIWWTP